MKAVEIKNVEKNTELADELIRFVKDFSWNEVKKHLLETLQSWTFTDWETPFAAIVNGHIVGVEERLLSFAGNISLDNGYFCDRSLPRI